MPKPKVISQPRTTQHLSMGINALADLLAPTLGPIGGVVANQRDFQGRPELLDDSATAVRRILELGDRRADVGAMMMRSMIWRVVQRAGDGGATAAVLARALYMHAARMMAAGANAMQLSRGVNLAIAESVKALRSQARPVRTENDLAAVAMTVIREPSLAAVLGEMSYLLGPDAHVTIEKFVAPYLQQFYFPGANYRAQIASMYFYTDPIQKRAVLPAGAIALVDGKLERVDQVVALLEAALASGAKTLTIVAASYSEGVIGLMMANNKPAQPHTNGDGAAEQPDKPDKQQKLMIVGVKFKDVGDARRAAYDDLAMLTGATVLGRSWSKSVGQVTQQDLGHTIRVEVAAEMLHVVPDQSRSDDLRQQTADLRGQLAKLTLDDEARPLVMKRLAALSGGMAVLKLGAESKHMRELMEANAERTLKVLSAAQYGGVVPGGGAALFHCIPALDAIEAEDDVALGVELVRRMLAAPLQQILENAHVPSAGVVMDQIRRAGPTMTYEVMGEQVVDAYDAGILDVTDVLATVLQTAASGALMALTTDAIVYHKKPQQAFNP